MNDFDKFMDENFITPARSKTIFDKEQPSKSISSMISPNPQTDNYVVIDEKAFKPGYLFAAINKGGATLSMKHGKGINIIRNGDWVVLQILEAGCGKAVQHQGATFSNAKQRQKNTNTVKVSGERNKKLAWGK